jgi:hypothetical protein
MPGMKLASLTQAQCRTSYDSFGTMHGTKWNARHEACLPDASAMPDFVEVVRVSVIGRWSIAGRCLSSYRNEW